MHFQEYIVLSSPQILGKEFGTKFLKSITQYSLADIYAKMFSHIKSYNVFPLEIVKCLYIHRVIHSDKMVFPKLSDTVGH